MLAQELIEKKRDGGELTTAELQHLLGEYASERIPDYQMAAFLMSVLFQGLSRAELSVLTRIIIDSGRRLDFRTDGGPPAVDKHSTGGVGDKVSLILAPLLAEYGLRVPMMSGRGLGHTGGTVDKLESIPGFRTDLDLEAFRSVLGRVGCAMIGQTPEIAPLDGRLYALRDVTATVPSIPLISASIISKKAAEGIGALVLDVKFGSGAFMRDPEQATELARALVDLATSEGLRATALLTRMDEPLGTTVGNALEVAESLRCLRGDGPPDLREVTLSLCVEAVLAAYPEESADAARDSLEELLDRGAALERFARLVEAQGGNPGIIEDGSILPRAPVQLEWTAPSDGWVVAADARRIGQAAVELGAGRRRMGDEVDPAVGFEALARVGDPVSAGQPLTIIHARSEDAARKASRRMGEAWSIGPEPPDSESPLVWKRLASE